MTLDTLIILTGGLVAMLPFLGFPNSWDTIIFLVAGVFIVVLGIIVRRRIMQSGESPRSSHGMFAESMPAQSSEHFSLSHEEAAR